MKFQSTYILLGVVGLLFLGLVVRTQFSKSTPKEIRGRLFEKSVVLGMKADEVDRIEIETDGNKTPKIVFVRKEKNWSMIEPVQARVNSYNIDEIARELLQSKMVTKNVQVKDRKTHNLEKPPVTVTLKQGDLSAKLSIGSIVDLTGNVFVLSSDFPDSPPLVIPKSDLTALLKAGEVADPLDTVAYLKQANDYRVTKLLGEITDPVTQTESLTIKRGKEELSLARDARGVWQFVAPSGYGEVEVGDNAPPAPPGAPNETVNNLRKLLNLVYDLQVASTGDFLDQAGDLKPLGLIDNPELIEIKLVRRTLGNEQPMSDTVLIGKPVEGQEKLYARLAGEPMVAKILSKPVSSIIKVMQEPKSLRNRDLLKLEIAKVDAVDVEIGPSKMELRNAGPNLWVLFDPNNKRYRGNGVAVNQLLEALTQKGQVLDFPPLNFPDEQLGIDAKNKAGEVRIWVEGIIPPKKEEAKKEEPKKDDKKEEPKKEEPKKDDKPQVKAEPTVRLIFGKVSGEGIYVRKIEGEKKTDFLVPKMLFEVNVKRPYLDYIEPTIKSIDPATISKISFNRGKEQFEFARDGNDWKFVLPEANKGRLADGSKINSSLLQLSRIRPARVISDQAKPEEISKWKLDETAPIMKLTFSDKDNNATTYLIGDDTNEAKLNCYFRLPGENFVYELPKLYVANFQQGELLDPVLFRIDASKLKSIKISGWQEIVGSVLTRELEQKDGKWVFRNNPGYELDQRKLESFLDEMAAVKAERLLAKTAPKPEYGLDVNRSGLLIEFTLEGDKVITLLLGIPEKDGKEIYAQTNQLPGDLFTLLADRFKSLREKPAVFKKD